MSSTESMKEKTYTARCHCDETIFTVTIPPLETGATSVNQCNCSVCTKKGYALVYPPREKVQFLKGWDQLKDYYFGNKTRPHKFCSNCGTNILIDFGKVEDEVLNKKLGISIRAIDGIEDMLSEGKITWRSFDGKHELGPPYKPLS